MIDASGFDEKRLEEMFQALTEQELLALELAPFPPHVHIGPTCGFCAIVKRQRFYESVTPKGGDGE